MRILAVGDTHANESFIAAMFDKAIAHDCDHILQLGDFGYWPHKQWGLDFLDWVAAGVDDSGIPLSFICGNHDNHDLLERLIGDDLEVRPGVHYIPRGARWSWGGAQFGALGGAYSIDMDHRVIGESWWRQEEVQEVDVRRLGREPLDVLVCHDIPLAVPVSKSVITRHEEASQRTRQRITDAMEATRPKLLIAGHWHQRLSHKLDSTRIEVLSHDGDPSDAWMVIDIANAGIDLLSAATEATA